jgi:glycerate kinase
MDSQDIYGKAPMAVAERAHARGIPTVAVVGSTGRDYRVVYGHGMDAVIGTIARPMTIDRAVRESSHLIAEAGMRAARLIRVGMTVQRKRGL